MGINSTYPVATPAEKILYFKYYLFSWECIYIPVGVCCIWSINPTQTVFSVSPFAH